MNGKQYNFLFSDGITLKCKEHFRVTPSEYKACNANDIRNFVENN